MVEAAERLGLGFAPALADLVRPSLVLDLTNSTDICLPLGSRLGGQPALPDSDSWPRKGGKPLACVAQINLAEVATVHIFSELPKSGLLIFFYDADAQPWGFDPADKGSFAVRYVPNPIGCSSVSDWPKDLGESLRFTDNAVTFRRIITLPSAGSAEITKLNLDTEQFEAYEQLLSEISDDLNQGSRSLLLGNPDQIQLGDMFDYLPLVTAGINTGCKLPDDARTRELREHAKEWRLLLQVESLETSNMIWGSMGLLYFCITAEALRARDFDAAWLALQCT